MNHQLINAANTLISLKRRRDERLNESDEPETKSRRFSDNDSGFAAEIIDLTTHDGDENVDGDNENGNGDNENGNGDENVDEDNENGNGDNDESEDGDDNESEDGDNENGDDDESENEDDENGKVNESDENGIEVIDLTHIDDERLNLRELDDSSDDDSYDGSSLLDKLDAAFLFAETPNFSPIQSASIDSITIEDDDKFTELIFIYD